MALGFVVDSRRFTGFFSDFFNDLKSSRRFQVAAVLWLPLFVAALILVIRMGERNTFREKFHEWSTTVIRESTIQYPDVEMVFANAPTSVTCKTVEPPSAIVPTNGACTDGRPWNQRGFTCMLFQLSHVTAKENQNNDFFGNPIACTMQFPKAANPDWWNANLETYLFTPGGFNTSSNWNRYASFIRPNQMTQVHLTHEYFFPEHQPGVAVWDAEVHSMTSVYATGHDAYNMTVFFRIPFGGIPVFWEHTGFDHYFMMAMWGGGIYFMYILHKITFSFLQFLLPHDSRLLRADGARSSEYTPLK